MLGITVYNFLMSFLWSSICILVFTSLKKRHGFIKKYGTTPILAILIFGVFRLFFSIELPFTRVIASENILPVIQNTMMSESDIYKLSYSEIILCVSLLVTMVLIIKTAWELVAQRRVLKRLQRRDDTEAVKIMDTLLIELNQVRSYNIIVSDEIRMPLVTGFFRPTILLPDVQIDDETMKYVLLHEWNHFSNRDMWVKLTVRIFCHIFWWNPFAHSLEKNLDSILEIKCDATSTKILNSSDREKYAKSIINIVQQIRVKEANTPLLFAGIAGSDSSDKAIINRFELLLYDRKITHIPKAITAICVLCLCFLSYIFVVQPDIPISDVEGSLLIDIDTSYIEKKVDGSYELYINGAYFRDITENELQISPHDKLEVRMM